MNWPAKNQPEIVENLAESDLQACLIRPRYFVAKCYGLLSCRYILIGLTIDPQSFCVGNESYVAVNSHFA
jgi:hypothetical protein